MRVDDKLLYEHVGRRIRSFRESQEPSMTQDELASRCGLERASVTNIESGNKTLTLHTLYNLCIILDVEPTTVLPTRAESMTVPVLVNVKVEGVLDEDVTPHTAKLIENLVSKDVGKVSIRRVRRGKHEDK